MGKLATVTEWRMYVLGLVGLASIGCSNGPTTQPTTDTLRLAELDSAFQQEIQGFLTDIPASITHQEPAASAPLSAQQVRERIEQRLVQLAKRDGFSERDLRETMAELTDPLGARLWNLQLVWHLLAPQEALQGAPAPKPVEIRPLFARRTEYGALVGYRSLFESSLVQFNVQSVLLVACNPRGEWLDVHRIDLQMTGEDASSSSLLTYTPSGQFLLTDSSSGCGGLGLNECIYSLSQTRFQFSDSGRYTQPTPRQEITFNGLYYNEATQQSCWLNTESQTSLLIGYSEHWKPAYFVDPEVGASLNNADPDLFRRCTVTAVNFHASDAKLKLPNGDAVRLVMASDRRSFKLESPNARYNGVFELKDWFIPK
jgi:hypothetical protein